MVYIDFSYFLKNAILQYVKARIKQYPNNIVNSKKEQERVEKNFPPGKYAESLSDYCNRVLIRKGVTSEFQSPDMITILYDPRIVSLEEVQKIMKQNSLIVEIIEQKPVTGRFGIFRC